MIYVLENLALQNFKNVYIYKYNYVSKFKFENNEYCLK